MDHLSSRQLVELEEGRLTEGETVEVVAHLDQCETCRSAMLTMPPAANDPLLARLREPLGDSFADEVQRDAALRAAAAIGAGDKAAAVSTSDETGGLGTSAESASDVRLDDAGGRSFGEYLVLNRIGAGGMGQVFKARHAKMKRIVALKTLPAATMQTPEAKKRFLREVEAAARLIHPNIVVAYDAGEFEGAPYLVMEYVAGRDLSTVVREEGPRSVAQAVGYCLQAARGLAYAHAQGVVHRDIKPANLLLDAQGTIKVLDMGLARLDDQAGAVARGEIEELTQSGQVMGTVDYMAPEQAFDTCRADAQADVYSLGCTLHRLLTGKPLYAGETAVQKIVAHRELPIPSLTAERSDVPPRLEQLFRRMVAKRPELRPTMTEVVTELEGMATAPRTAEIGRRRTPPRKWLIAAAAGAAALVVWGIVVKIKDQNGDVIAEVHSPAGVGAEVIATPAAVPPAGAAASSAADEPFDDREAAEWVFGKRGFVDVEYRGEEVRARRTSELPAEAFRVRNIILPVFPGSKVTAAELAKLGGLRLKRWHLPQASLTNAEMSMIGAHEELRELNLFENPGVGDSGFAYLKNCVDLETLDIARTGVTEVGLPHLAGFKKLKTLNLSVLQVDDAGLKVLRELPKLEELAVDLCPVTGEFADHLRQAPLKSLEITDWKAGPGRVTRRGLEAVASLRSLEFLKLDNQRQIKAEWLTPLAGHPSLRTLSLNYTALGDEIVPYLGAVPQLMEVKLKDTQFTAAGVAALLKLRPGIKIDFESHERNGDSPPPAMAPFDAARARSHQEAWAGHLGVPVETTNGAGMKFRLIPPGEFEMGTSAEQARDVVAKFQRNPIELNKESPQHRVVLSKPSYMGSTEVTIGQFRKFVDATGYVTEAEKYGFGDSPLTVADDKVTPEMKRANWRSPGFPVTDQMPVTQVTYADCIAYCEWLSSLERRVYRLPTEAEWEFACRAGTTTMYWFGDDVGQLGEYAWFNGNSGGRTHAAGLKPANPFGLHDMTGNAYERCHDVGIEDYYRQSPLLDPRGPASGPTRAYRGGSVQFADFDCRSAHRNWFAATHRRFYLGFRCLLETEPRPQ